MKADCQKQETCIKAGSQNHHTFSVFMCSGEQHVHLILHCKTMPHPSIFLMPEIRVNCQFFSMLFFIYLSIVCKSVMKFTIHKVG